MRAHASSIAEPPLENRRCRAIRLDFLHAEQREICPRVTGNRSFSAPELSKSRESPLILHRLPCPLSTDGPSSEKKREKTEETLLSFILD